MQNPEKTNMTTEPKRTKMVKLVIQNPAQLRSGVIASPGQVVEVEEDEAKELLSFKQVGGYSFAGERDGDSGKERHVYKKAVPYVEPSSVA